MSNKEKLNFSKSIENKPRLLEAYNNSLREDLEKEIRRILGNEELLGEGRAAEVFTSKIEDTNLSVCVKIWRPENEKLPIEKRKEFQFISPEKEFDLQDSLYSEGFINTPRPIAFGKYGDYNVMVMEQIKGYTFKELTEKGAKIGNLKWENLARMVAELNNKHHVAHRDLHTGNIMFATEDEAKPGAEVSGEMYIIDFGTAKRTLGSPTPEDFEERLTLSSFHVNKFSKDPNMVEGLKPNPGHPEDSPFKE